MPHCIIEYSAELEKEIQPSLLIDKVYKGALNSHLFINSDIKIRTIPYVNHQIGHEKINFINIMVRVLTGRTVEQRKILSTAILDEFKTTKIQPLSITIEICEIENESYSKLVL